MSVRASNELLEAGVRAQASGRVDEAATLYRQALAAHPDNAHALCNLGYLLHQLGESERAEAMLERALRLKPRLVQIHLNLSLVRHALGRHEQAVRACELGLKSAPGNPQLLNNLAVNLQQLGRTGEALDVVRRMIRAAPREPAAHYFAGTLHEALGEAAEALHARLRAAELGPREALYQVAAGEALLRSGRCGEALERLDAALALRPWEVRALALKTVALAALGREEEERWLSDPERLAHTHHIGETGLDDSAQADLNRELATFADRHPSMREDPPENATYRAWHSGNLDGERHPAIHRLKDFIRHVMEARLAALSAEDPAHPFARMRPGECSLHLWAVRMSGGGRMVPHIHTDGWLSGVYYVQVPSIAARADGGQAGWLALGPPRPDLAQPRAPRERRIQPRPGLMVSFPSYVWHDTVPLPEDVTETRLCYAWDLQPRR